MLRPSCCRSTYTRIAPGVWRYPWGDRVPDGADLTLRTALRRHEVCSDGPLTSTLVTWGRRLQELEGPMLPAANDPDDLIIGLDAAELRPEEMLDLAQLADLLGQSRARTDSQVARGLLPGHQLVIDGVRRWARPVVARWTWS